MQVRSQMASGRLLRELLEEKQEPFLLDIYLLENGCSSKRLLKRDGGGFLRSLVNKFVHGKVIRKALNWDNKSIESGRLSVFDCFSEMGIKTHDDKSDRFSCSGISARELGGEHQWRCMEMEDSKQLSPVSVLEFHNHRFKEENPSSTSSLDSPREAPDISAFPQYTESKKGSSQGEQLMLDCVREAEEMIWDSHGCLGPEMTEKVINEKILSWERLKGDVTSLTQLLGSDMSGFRKGRSQFRPEVRELGVEIEAAIFEEIIHVTVLEMLGTHCT